MVRKSHTPHNPKKPHMRGSQLIMFTRPLHPNDRFTPTLYPHESLLSFYNDRHHVYYRTGRGPWHHLRYRDFDRSGNWINCMHVTHRGHRFDGTAYVKVHDSFWEWHLSLKPHHYFNLIDVGLERALFRSRRKQYSPAVPSV